MDKRFASLWRLLALALLALLAARRVEAGETIIYVSPSGNDAWAGTLPLENVQKTDGPVATLERARDLVRAAKAGQGGSPAPTASSSAAASTSSSSRWSWARRIRARNRPRSRGLLMAASGRR